MVPHGVPGKRSGSSPKKPRSGRLNERQSTPITGNLSAEDLYRSILEICPDATYKRNLSKDQYDYISPVIEQITGLTAAEFFPLTLADIMARIHPDDVNAFKQSIKDAAYTGKEIVEYRFKHKQGEYRWLSDHFVVIRDDEGWPMHLFGAVRDITERKNVEQALRESEEKFRTLTQATFEGVAITEKGRVIDCNDQFFRMLGYGPEEMISREVAEFLAPEGRVRIMNNILHEREAITEHVMIRKDGGRITVEAHGKNETYRGRRMRFTAVHDITKRKWMEEALRQSEEQYRTFFELGAVGMGQADPVTGKLLQVNDRFCEVTGYSRQELLSRTVEDLTHPEDRETDWAKFQRMLRGEIDEYLAEKRYVRKDGQVIWVLVTARAMRDTGGKPIRTAGILIDITERKRMEQELRNSHDDLEARVFERTEALRRQTLLAEHERDRLMTLIDSMNEGVWFTHTDGRVVLVNSVAKAQAAEVGIDPDGILQSQSYSLLSQVDMFSADGTPLQMEQFVRVFQGEPFAGVEIGLRNRKTGEMFYRRMSANPILDEKKRIEGAITVVQDITASKRAEKEQTRLEEQLRQATKMEAIGTLAGGIAHDFNNMLAVIIGNAEMALDDVTGNAEAARKIEQIVKASKRATDLVKQILAFSRKTETGRNPINLAPLLHETLKFLQGTLPSTIRMVLNIQTEKDAVVADVSQIQQVLMNLSMNAAHAMRENGGVLTIGISDVAVNEDILPDSELQPGTYVKLTVQDTGTGMTEEVRQRIFEPFFTTKEAGMGTGMGLAVVYGIVKSHGGAVTAKSEPGKGSAFNVFLPYAHTGAKEQQQEEGDVPGGSERILLVDDEPSIVETVSLTLERLGYRVSGARSGAEAWKMFSEEPTGFDLVITDQTMPDLTGIELAQKMLNARKDLPIILFTGYSETVSPEKAKSIGISEFVMKPLSKQKAAEAIRQVLDSRERTK